MANTKTTKCEDVIKPEDVAVTENKPEEAEVTEKLGEFEDEA